MITHNRYYEGIKHENRDVFNASVSDYEAIVSALEWKANAGDTDAIRILKNIKHNVVFEPEFQPERAKFELSSRDSGSFLLIGLETLVTCYLISNKVK